MPRSFSWKKWARSMLSGKGDSANRSGKQLNSDAELNLPLELVIEVALILGSNYSDCYYTFVRVSRQFKVIMERECLQFLPIRLESPNRIIAFHRFLILRPELAPSIRQLWIRGARSRQKPKAGYSEPTNTTWRQFKSCAFEQMHIINSCTNLVSLGCSFPVMFLCFRFMRGDIFFKHDKLTDLTLFENWNLWSCFLMDPPMEGPNLFLQLTHLTILDGVAPNFPTHLFPLLRYFSAEIYPASRQVALEAFKADKVLEAPLPSNLRRLSQDVNVRLHMVNDSELGIKRVFGEGNRCWEMRVGPPEYFRWWCQRLDQKTYPHDPH
ncbi:hypothetical protein FA15DRAFT_663779 [Coprinopsis marcescibilis]|uniref:Uncharacterized protein n=1 Tax=Coprinopsis marcescibilis TaxID=230819 RepID=A0A5C3LA35_COPMA|nr:hypothetical protein FA15DRAFT_663779 [Coprinopsis marcescibilis]